MSHGKPFAIKLLEMYSAREIARAAGLPEACVRAAMPGGGRAEFVGHDEAVALGRRLIRERREPFAVVATPAAGRQAGMSLAVSGTLHAGVVAVAVFLVSMGSAPVATPIEMESPRPEDMHLVFLNIPGPGGGGGGGGLLQKPAPPKALREGHKKISSPLPIRRPPPPLEPIVRAPEPPVPPPLSAEPLPVVVAPIVVAPADQRDRSGVLQQARTEVESRGPGQGGGVGSGQGTGIGEGSGTGVGPGSGGGTGGGPYRPGSGITPPRVLREVKADYTDEARRSGITGDVVLEIVVRRDGSVGDVKLLEGLRGGLNDRAIQAVRQWRFAPATRQGVAVDVIVEVAVEFKLR